MFEKKTLIFALDRTLVHREKSEDSEYDAKIEINNYNKSDTT